METRKEQEEKASQEDFNWESQGNVGTVCDERMRSEEVPEGTVCSITFSGRSESWGEFLSEEDANGLFEWLGEILGK